MMLLDIWRVDVFSLEHPELKFPISQDFCVDLVAVASCCEVSKSGIANAICGEIAIGGIGIGEGRNFMSPFVGAKKPYSKYVLTVKT